VVVRSTVPPGTVEDVVTPGFAPSCLPEGWHAAAAMCPEFLREGSGVADFLGPPFVVVGAGDPRVHDTVARMFDFLDLRIHRVDIRTAEALKYACNAFHATKVSFANEMARILRNYGIDSRTVMEIFCEDELLNISRAYLRPGFAFGGSCLPKDLRSLLHMARMNSLDVPLLAGVSRTNEIAVTDVVDRLIAIPGRSIAMLGLSFKMDTDDLRESPNVDLTERLIGKGFDVRIYDPIINPERLIGANLRYIESRLPHVRKLLKATPWQALADCDVAVVATSDGATLDALCDQPPARIVDLHGRLGSRIEALPGYEGIGWAL
jgi:GDP-mannose 6-dehydrogenase